LILHLDELIVDVFLPFSNRRVNMEISNVKAWFLGALLCAMVLCPHTFAATDVLFLIDTTGSMNGFGNFQRAFKSIIEAVNAKYCPETMYAVADYRNYIDGKKYADYGVNLVQSFTYDAQEAVDAIDELTGGYGGDDPESQLKAMVSIADNWLTSSGDLGFHGRAEAQKIIVWAGDCHGHIAGDEPYSDLPHPPPGYYPTLDATIDSLTAQGIMVLALNAAGPNDGLDWPFDGLNHHTPPAHRQATEITTATGGRLFNNAGSGSPAIIDAVVRELTCFSFIKTDNLPEDPNCAGINETFVYSIYYENPTSQTLYNTYIIDFLPSQVEFLYEIIDGQPVYPSDPDPNAMWECLNDPNCTWPPPAAAGSPGVYDAGTVIWPIGTIAPGTSGSVSFVVRVNDQSSPLVPLHNVAEIWDDTRRLGYAEEFTNVCPWDMGGVIYVDVHAPAGGNGTRWDMAYNDLQDAIERINFVNDPNILYEVRIADGPYNPGDTFNWESYPDTFIIPDGVSVFGGYAGYGAANPDERNISQYKTILTGYIRENARNNIVVKLNNGCLLDGVTVENAAEKGIDGSGASSAVVNCVIKNNKQTGIYSLHGDLTCRWSEIHDNSRRGIWHSGSGYSLTCINSKIFANEWDGILTENSTATIINSLIYQNGSASSQPIFYYGINLINPSGNPTIRNCTVGQNTLAGIRRVGGTAPKVKNCVLFYNDSQGGFANLKGITSTWHCCLTDPNAPETVKVNPAPDSYGNIMTHPKFAYTTEPNNLPPVGNYHLAYDSPCVNLGDPNDTGVDELDIDGEPRQYGIIDIGADEMIACGNEPWDIAHPFDFSADGIINMVEYAAFASSWLVPDSNELFNPQCDLNNDNYIDLADFAGFCEGWLWTACWRLDLQQLLTQQMMMSSVENVAEASGFKSSAVIPAQECHPGL
jgi:hypothetical protein